MQIKRVFRKIKTLFIYAKYRFLFSNINWSEAPTFLEDWSMIDVDQKSTISIGKKYEQRKNAILECKNGGKLQIGSDVFFNRNCIVTCLSNISIGDRCIFGPNVVIYDHDHAFSAKEVSRGTFTLGSVTIGKDCWIGAGAIILKNTTIGDHCVIGAGTLVRGNVPANSVLLNKKEPFIKEISS